MSELCAFCTKAWDPVPLGGKHVQYNIHGFVPALFVFFYLLPFFFIKSTWLNQLEMNDSKSTN
jgi:hypothetical protein